MYPKPFLITTGLNCRMIRSSSNKYGEMTTPIETTCPLPELTQEDEQEVTTTIPTPTPKKPARKHFQRRQMQMKMEVTQRKVIQQPSDVQQNNMMRNQKEVQIVPSVVKERSKKTFIGTMKLSRAD